MTTGTIQRTWSITLKQNLFPNIKFIFLISSNIKFPANAKRVRAKVINFTYPEVFITNRTDLNRWIYNISYSKTFFSCCEEHVDHFKELGPIATPVAMILLPSGHSLDVSWWIPRLNAKTRKMSRDSLQISFLILSEFKRVN